jgi:hypothetical protein
MIFTEIEKEMIGKMLLERQELSGLSQAKFAKANDFNPADISNLRGETWRKQQTLIGESKWIRFARFVGYNRKNELTWNTANTRVKLEIDAQLTACKSYAFTAILCDDAGIGKTYACKEFAARNPHVYYIDCSNARSSRRLIKAIGKAVGVDTNGRIDDIFEDAMYVLSVTDQALLIFDEVGDLDDKAFLELKRLYNNLESICGIYLVGSDGLKKKIERGEATRKVGYTENFSRYGKDFTKIMPIVPEERAARLLEMTEQLLSANDVTDKNQVEAIKMKVITGGLKDMRKVYREVLKIRIKKEAGL